VLRTLCFSSAVRRLCATASFAFFSLLFSTLFFFRRSLSLFLRSSSALPPPRPSLEWPLSVSNFGVKKSLSSLSVPSLPHDEGVLWPPLLVILCFKRFFFFFAIAIPSAISPAIFAASRSASLFRFLAASFLLAARFFFLLSSSLRRRRCRSRFWRRRSWSEILMSRCVRMANRSSASSSSSSSSSSPESTTTRSESSMKSSSRSYPSVQAVVLYFSASERINPVNMAALFPFVRSGLAFPPPRPLPPIGCEKIHRKEEDHTV